MHWNHVDEGLFTERDRRTARIVVGVVCFVVCLVVAIKVMV